MTAKNQKYVDNNDNLSTKSKIQMGQNKQLLRHGIIYERQEAERSKEGPVHKDNWCSL